MQKQRCTQEISKDIEDFGNTFIELQVKRHKADYDPFQKYYKSNVDADIDRAEYVIDRFERAPARDRRAFAAFVLFRQPRKE